MSTKTKFAIVGAGAGGVCAGIKLRESGRNDFLIFDRAEKVGGTWHRNTYPGATCDIASHLYSYSFAPSAEWSRPFARQAEIQTYLERVAMDSGLKEHLRLGMGVASARWDAGSARWTLTLDSGDEVEAQFVIAAVGMFGDIAMPEIDGLETFEGTSFHSAQWDHDHDLKGERVAVIGSAASAVQFIPEVAKEAAQLHVFQRTPNWVLAKDDTPFSEEQRNAFRAKLTPDHPFGCKRPLLSNSDLQAFNQSNVELVTDEIEKITPKGVVTKGGQEREVDTILLATGFKVTHYASAIDFVGRGGLKIGDSWDDGPEAYLGCTTSSFPNLFMLYGPNTNGGNSIILMLEYQVEYFMGMIDKVEKAGLDWLDVRRDVMDDFNAELQKELDGIEVWQASCNNYYRTESGRIVTQWPHPFSEYRARVDRDDLRSFETGQASAPRGAVS